MGFGLVTRLCLGCFVLCDVSVFFVWGLDFLWRGGEWKLGKRRAVRFLVLPMGCCRGGDIFRWVYEDGGWGFLVSVVGFVVNGNIGIFAFTRTDGKLVTRC